MHNYFYNNSLLQKLCQLLDELTENDDKEVIDKLIKKQMPTNSKYNFSLAEISSVTKEDAGHHSVGIRKSKCFATEYLYSLYKIDFEFSYKQDSILEDLMYKKWDDIISKMIKSFEVTRALIYRNTNIEIRKEVSETFDLYVTKIFIEKYTEIINEYNKIKIN
jgi:HD-GYP domain-containing protein (c-di-GMP phosphodiesterase class II)